MMETNKKKDGTYFFGSTSANIYFEELRRRTTDSPVDTTFWYNNKLYVCLLCIVEYAMLLYGVAWCCVVLRGAAWCCVVLRNAA